MIRDVAEALKSRFGNHQAMREVHPNLLWIGHAMDLRNPRELMDLGIAAVVDLAYEEPPAQLPRELIYLRFPLVDGGGNDPTILRQALQSTVDLISAGKRTLVACSAGMSRSPTVAVFALAAHLGQSPEEVIERIADSKALEVKVALWNDLVRLLVKVRTSL